MFFVLSYTQPIVVCQTTKDALKFALLKNLLGQRSDYDRDFSNFIIHIPDEV